MGQDIFVKVGEHLFNYRVAAIIQQQHCVLINRLVGQNFWFLPGGRVQASESTQAAVVREICEELSVACEVVRPVFLHETFFLHGEKQFHEVGVYYEVTLAPEDAAILGGSSVADGGIELEWLELKRLSDIDLRPPFLVSRLTQLPDTLEHIIETNPDL